jgi:VWFA-related protein
MRSSTVAVLAWLLAFTAFSQTKLTESIEVRIANVDVVVRDRSGNPVSGLTKDDFELYEDGVKQTITNLYEVHRDDVLTPTREADSATADSSLPIELRQRKLLLFVDSASLQPARRKAVLDSAEDFIARMRPEDETMVVCWRLGVQVLTPFTSDKEAVKQGIAALQRYAPAGESQLSALRGVKREVQSLIEEALDGVFSWQEAYSRALLVVDRHSQELTMLQEHMLDALGRMLSGIAGIEGKKVLVFVTETFPERPGAELYRYVNDEFALHMDRRNPLDMQMLTGAMGNQMQHRIELLAKEASAAGVTMYTIGVQQADSEFSAENVAALDAGESFSRVANTSSALQTLARVTGGVALTHTSNFGLAFETIGRDLGSYYSLGYRPAEKAANATRRIAVKSRNPVYSVRARETFVLKSTDEQMNDRVISNLLIDGFSTDWPISIQTGTPARDGGKFRIPVQVTLPSTITFLPQDKSLLGGFILYLVVGTSDGRTSQVMRRPQGLKIPASAELAVRAKPMTFSTSLRVNGGQSILSVGVIDQLSGTTGFARAKFVAR